MDRTREDLTYKIDMLKGEVESIKVQNYNLKVEDAKKEDSIAQMKNRKLTWRERFYGKIITNEDENKRI
jgi:hypothetical protein